MNHILLSFIPGEPRVLDLLLKFMEVRVMGDVVSTGFGAEGVPVWNRGSSLVIPSKRLCLGVNTMGCRLSVAIEYLTMWYRALRANISAKHHSTQKNGL